MPKGRGRRLLARIFSPELQIWRGDAPLARVFWGYGVLLSTILLGAYGATIYFDLPRAEQILLICLGLYTLWILVAIWRSADGVTTVWSVLARMLTVAWAVNIAMILLFRELELMTLFFGG